MLKKLPNLLRKLSLQRKNNYNTSNKTNNNVLIDGKGDSLNLIDEFSDKKTYAGKNKYFVYLNITICIIFITSYLISSLLSYNNTRLINILNNNVKELNEYTDFEKEYLSVSNSIEIYKNLKNNKISLHIKTNDVISKIPETLKLRSLNIEKNTFQISLTGNDILSFSLLLDEYLNSNSITKISLQDLTLVPSSFGNITYVVRMNGEFR